MKKKSDFDLQCLKKIQAKFNHTYLNGVYLALNAIPDAYLLLDGTLCAFGIMFFVHKTHDLFSDLVRQNSAHRVCSTGTLDNTIINDVSDTILKFILDIKEMKDCSVIFMCSQPMATITGVHYDLIIHKMKNKISVPLIEIPSKSLHADWLSGYEETLLAIARKIELSSNLKKSNNVAIVGYLFDRNEGDHIGNLRELKRIFNAMSLNLVCVWLSGCSFSELYEVERAGTIISLPYGRRPAREIANKTKADLIELNLPLGIQNTKDWITAIAKKLKKIKEASALIDKELKEVIPITNLILPKYFIGRKFTFYGDPYLCNALTDSLIELGGEITHAIVFSNLESNKNLAQYKMPSFKILYEPICQDAYELLDRSKADVYIGNSYAFHLLRIKGNKKPFVEFGCPSFYYHCLFANPFFCFKGYINFLNRVINNIYEGNCVYERESK